MNKKLILIVGLVLSALFLVAGCTTQSQAPPEITGDVVTIFKSPSCGCCVGHAATYRQEGYAVNTIETQDLDSVKQKYGISREMASCHTAIIGEYFVEGHVPMEAVEKLLVEKPDIDGIALPGMPAGSPGMPGVKQGTWTIYAIKEGMPSEFMKI